MAQNDYTEQNAPTELQKRQTGWLTELYLDLVGIALAVTHNRLLAEDAVSDAVTVCFTKILAGEIDADHPKQFAAYVHKIVRSKARDIVGGKGKKKYANDAAGRDLAREKALRNTRPDKRQTGAKITVDEDDERLGFLETCYPDSIVADAPADTVSGGYDEQMGGEDE